MICSEWQKSKGKAAMFRLTRGQPPVSIKEHVESGNQKFEVRSNNDELGINKGQTIHVDEYEIKYKHKR